MDRNIKNLVVNVEENGNLVSFSVVVDDFSVKGIGYYMFNPSIILNDLDVSVRTLEDEEVDIDDDEYMELVEDIENIVCDHLEDNMYL